jgi:RNase P protein component
MQVLTSAQIVAGQGNCQRAARRNFIRRRIRGLASSVDMALNKTHIKLQKM